MNSFLDGFIKRAEATRKEVSTVAVINKDGKWLMGKRRDNGKWTCAGGHLDAGESPLDGAVRELKEESGIEARPSDLKFIRTIKNKENGYVVHGYKYEPKDDVSTSMRNDPDGEVYRWHWVNVNNIKDEDLHVPREKGNVLLSESTKLAYRAALAKGYRKAKEVASTVSKDNNVIDFVYKQHKKRSGHEKEALLKELGLSAALLSGGAAHAQSLLKSPAAKAAYKQVKTHKGVLKDKFLKRFSEKATKSTGSNVSHAAAPVAQKNIAEHAYDKLKDADKHVQKNYGLKIRDKVEKSFDGGKGKITLKDLGQGGSVHHGNYGADYHKGKLNLTAKIGDNTHIEASPTHKSIAMKWSKAF